MVWFNGFNSRGNVGRELSSLMGNEYRNREDLVVLFGSFNSAPIAHETARGLGASAMDIFQIRDIRIPGCRGSVGVISIGGARCSRRYSLPG